MAKIDHLEMGAKIMALDNIQVKKGFLGMGSKLIYKPTNSVVKRLETILATEPEHREEAISKNPVSPKEIGNMKLEACISDDHQFVAAQLLGFKDFDYIPLTEVHIYEGKTAEAFAQLF